MRVAGAEMHRARGLLAVCGLSRATSLGDVGMCSVCYCPWLCGMIGCASWSMCCGRRSLSIRGEGSVACWIGFLLA